MVLVDQPVRHLLYNLPVLHQLLLALYHYTKLLQIPVDHIRAHGCAVRVTAPEASTISALFLI